MIDFYDYYNSDIEDVILEKRAQYEYQQRRSEQLLYISTERKKRLIQDLKDDSVNSQIPNQEDPSKYMDENFLLGAKGEQIALKHFKGKFHEVTIVADLHYKGYDIEVLHEGSIYGIEVKTSSKLSGFYITRNECYIASLMKDKYRLVFVHLEQDKDQITLYELKETL